jgi:GntR family transcriptional regulator/MocR family aminotransferase
VLIEPGAPFFDGIDPPQNYFRIAYSSIPANRIPEGIDHIADTLRSMPAGDRT